MLGGRMRYAPTLTDERNSENRLAIQLFQRKITGDSFAIHPPPGMFCGRMRYVSTLTDERDSENRLVVRLSERKDLYVYGAFPIYSMKVEQSADRPSYSISDHSLFIIHHGQISLHLYDRSLHGMHSCCTKRDRPMGRQVASPWGTAHACSSYTRSRRR